MGGTSYTMNPVKTLEMISASFIFGESQYYRQQGLGISLPEDVEEFWVGLYYNV